MSIINTLNKAPKTYKKHCLTALNTTIQSIHLDYSRGETDWTTLLFFEKNKVSFKAALAILTLRLKMYSEEWGDFEHYTPEDIERWIGFLQLDYADSIFIEKVEKEVFENDFFVKRLHQQDSLKNIKMNDKTIDFASFKSNNPLFLEKINRVAQSKFEGLHTEYYVETERHFVLFHWFTTA
jgi:hypothetical protein